MFWERHTKRVEGVLVPGDPSVPPTRWWNRIFLALWRWKTVAVFRFVDPLDAGNGYSVGFVPSQGPAMTEPRVSYDTRFRMKVGHEPCRFFAINLGGNEVRIALVAITTINDQTYADVPLH